ncbi:MULTISPECIES: hypothetical protein [unclassified Serratia (in: enterobacteria)]|uniref:Acb2/Tad1 domain-containing protein n=1 Tax=unclassified Serratia (in: enterobacteria) TaxID=2647522 RepID=UPI00050106A1|nr:MULTISPECIES: hypothetical protein [unclassified Serratia (in: enterobacteria)]KFK95036.1 hypothetical protein IV04_21555 [Serratia sp. Ag1]KFK95997.1 hypothetical protein JV45_06245 [Serratia sp. Ag2]
MNEAKPQDGSTVKGYRTLNDAEIDAMNRLKNISKLFIKELDLLVECASAEPVERGSHRELERQQTLRWLAIARTDMQTACMAACRAVARPDADS